MSKFQKYRAIVAHCDPAEQQRISHLLEKTRLFQVLLTTQDGAECVRQAVRRQPDVIIAQAVLTGIDGLEVLRQVKARCGNTKVLLLTSYNILMANRIAQADADYIIMEPCDDQVVVDRAIELLRASRESFPVHLVWDYTNALLAKLNAPRHLKGYPYVRDGILMVVLDPNLIHCHAGPNGLYAQLCRRHNVPYKNLEHCIRSLGDRIHKDASLKLLEQYFSPADLSRGHIPNLTLIATLAAHVTEELRRTLENRDSEDNAAH